MLSTCNREDHFHCAVQCIYLVISGDALPAHAQEGAKESSEEDISNHDGDHDSGSWDDDDDNDEHDDGSGRSVAIRREKHASSGGNLSSSPEDADYIMFNLPPPIVRPPQTMSSANLLRSSTSSIKLVKDSEMQQDCQATKHPLQIHTHQNSSRHSLKREVSLPRSKSCREGRSSAPPDDFNICPKQQNYIHPDIHHLFRDAESTRFPRDGEGGLDGCEHRPFSDEGGGGGGFKCGVLCMFVPALSAKIKRVSSRKSKKSASEDGPAAAVSKVASLEKFECGSWASSAILDAEEEEECVKPAPCFGLPVKVIAENEAGDMNAPLHATFLFDRDLKGVLKRDDSKLGPKSFARHVRFSKSAQESAPSSPNERSRKVREQFRAYIEAQI